jgi:hypothetical protein
MSPLAAGSKGHSLAEALQEYMSELEQEISKRLSNHSKYFNLYVSRRLSILDLAARSRSFHWSETELEAFLREALAIYWQFRRFTIAALRAGKHGMQDMHIGPARTPAGLGYVTPNALSKQDAFDILLAWLLIGEYEFARYCLKRAGKGGSLVWLDKHRTLFDVALDSQDQTLVNRFDLRINRSANPLSFFGSWASLDVSHDFPTPDSRLFVAVSPWPYSPPGSHKPLPDSPVVLTLYPNMAHQVVGSRWPLAMGGVHTVDAPSWLFQWQDLADVLPRLQLLRRLQYQYDVEDLILTLSAITDYQKTICEAAPERWVQIFAYGYSIWGDPQGIIRHEILPRFARSRAKFIAGSSAAENLPRLEAALRQISWNDEKLDNVDLLAAPPGNLIYSFTADSWFIDWTAMHDALVDFVTPLGKFSGMIGDLRGHDYEHSVADFLSDYCSGKTDITIWWLGHVRGPLRFHDGETRDLDIGIVIGARLLLVEAKAHASTRDLLIVGDPDALARRWEWEIKSDIRQIDTLAECLSAAPSGRNFAIPKGVAELIPLVCGPLPEWIPEMDRRWWLYDDIPRICTPDELIEVIDRVLKDDVPVENRLPVKPV